MYGSIRATQPIVTEAVVAQADNLIKQASSLAISGLRTGGQCLEAGRDSSAAVCIVECGVAPRIHTGSGAYRVEEPVGALRTEGVFASAFWGVILEANMLTSGLIFFATGKACGTLAESKPPNGAPTSNEAPPQTDK